MSSAFRVDLVRLTFLVTTLRVSVICLHSEFGVFYICEGSLIF